MGAACSSLAAVGAGGPLPTNAWTWNPEQVGAWVRRLHCKRTLLVWPTSPDFAIGTSLVSVASMGSVWHGLCRCLLHAAFISPLSNSGECIQAHNIGANCMQPTQHVYMQAAICHINFSADSVAVA